MSAANIGWLFYRDYYKDIKDIDGDFTTKSKAITDKKLADYHVPNYENLIDGLTTIPLKTTYPGLLLGSGYQHNIKSESAFKIGFYFDYSSGLPVVPGSSVKGLLRSAFPFHNKDLGADYQKSRVAYINEILIKAKIIDAKLGYEIIKALELEIFEGSVNDENIKISERDLFLDAFPKESLKHNGRFLDKDYITHHENPLKNPNPVMFLKVLPQVEYVFNFRLTNSKIDERLTGENKRELFKQILLDFGVGAKTNVGYGQFEDPDALPPKKSTTVSADSYSSTHTPSKSKIPQVKKAETFERKHIDKIKAGNPVVGTVIESKNSRVYVKVDVDGYEKECDFGYASGMNAGKKILLKVIHVQGSKKKKNLKLIVRFVRALQQ